MSLASNTYIGLLNRHLHGLNAGIESNSRLHVVWMLGVIPSQTFMQPSKMIFYPSELIIAFSKRVKHCA